MKCEHCGAPIGLEDKFCAYCGAPNTQALLHQADMEHYQQEFQRTQAEVMKSTGRMARISSNLIILAVLVVLNIGAAIFLFNANELGWNARVKATEAKASVYQADMEEMIEEKEYLKLYDYYLSNHITSVDALSDYSGVCRAAGCLRNIYGILCGRNNLGMNSYSTGKGIRPYEAESLADEIGRLWEIEDNYYGNELSERDKAVIAEIREYAKALLLGYTALDRGQVEELPNLSRTKAIEMIREGVTILE